MQTDGTKGSSTRLGRESQVESKITDAADGTARLKGTYVRTTLRQSQLFKR